MQKNEAQKRRDYVAAKKRQKSLENKSVWVSPERLSFILIRQERL